MKSPQEREAPRLLRKEPLHLTLLRACTTFWIFKTNREAV